MRRSEYQNYERGRYSERDADIPGAAPRGRAEYGMNRPNLSSARSDYGPPAYGGELDDRGLEERESQRHSERGAFARAGDEVLSWFGDEEAERRRRMDRMRESHGYDEQIRRAVDGPLATRRPGAEAGPVPWPDRPQWSSAGPYVGRGPRGYQRSDARIYEDICDRLTDHQEVDPSDVEVRINNGEVTLAGTVESRYEKHLIEDIAESVPGVREVYSHLRIRQFNRPV
ncbi:MAG TPA: BON domain-containing protein [Blastocatellia bacterium]|nr:BON domain-containing protein [Blastocatellia bacterium]